MNMQATTRPFNKAEAFTLVKSMVEGAQPTQAEIASLLLHFAPATAKGSSVLKDSLKWLALFVGVKDVREGLNYLYSDGASLYGCDGYTLAWAPTPLTAGYYCPKTFIKVEGIDYKYPDVSRIIPSLNGDLSLLADVSGPLEVVGTAKHQSIKDVYGTNYQASYLARAERGGNAMITGGGKDGTALRGKTDLGEFVLMGLRK